MLSYWEKQSLLHYDHIVAGAGIVGLSTAISLKEKFPGDRVLVLERALLPTGASTRNAGFACVGSPTELLDYLDTMSKDEVVRLADLRWQGLKKLRARLGDESLGYRENGSYELISAGAIGVLEQLDRLNDMLKPVLGGNAFSLASDRISRFGFDPEYTQALIENHYEGELDAGKMMRALIDLAISRGVEIKTGCEVEQFEDTSDGVRVLARRGVTDDTLEFQARGLVICTNAFTKRLIPELDLQPGRGQVIITNPIAGLPFKGIFHFDKGYYYFREIEGRVLFGGGRHLDFKGETTTEFGANTQILQDLEEKLRTIILPATPFTLAGHWSGIMAFGSTRHPLVKRYSSHILVGVRMGGMGVAIGTAIGEQLAEMTGS